MNYRSSKTRLAPYLAFAAVAICGFVLGYVLPASSQASKRSPPATTDNKINISSDVMRVTVDFTSGGFDRIGNNAFISRLVAPQTPNGSSSLVISQIYGNGGTPGATYSSNYFEVFNRGASVVDLNHWTVRIEGSNLSASLGKECRS